MGENRYLINGNIEIYVTFNDDSDMCTIRLGEKHFDIQVELLQIIAYPAP